MGPSADALVSSTVAGSALLPQYGTAVDNISAYEKITAQGAGTKGAAPTGPAAGPASGAGHAGGALDPSRSRRRSPADRGGHSWPAQQPAAPTPGDPAEYGDASGRQQPQQEPRRTPRQPQPTGGGGIGGDLAGALGGGLDEPGPLAGDPTWQGAAPRRLRHVVETPPPLGGPGRHPSGVRCPCNRTAACGAPRHRCRP